jgi:hypothetical protein
LLFKLGIGNIKFQLIPFLEDWIKFRINNSYENKENKFDVLLNNKGHYYYIIYNEDRNELGVGREKG